MNAFRITPYFTGYRVFAFNEWNRETFYMTGLATKAHAEEIAGILNTGLIGEAANRAFDLGVAWVASR